MASDAASLALGQPPSAETSDPATSPPAALGCCPLYHAAIELLGKRWTGAIVRVLMHRSPLRFSEVSQAVPQLSDRLLSERMKELEARGVVIRTVVAAAPARVEYELSPMGRDLEPALAELEAWAQRWLAPTPAA